MLTLEEIDLSKGDGHYHPDINTKDYYLGIFHGTSSIGRFSKQWYGLNFDCQWGNYGIQFDTPGTNGSDWQKLYRIVGLKECLKTLRRLAHTSST
jgi:hypothetical protein